MRKNRRRQPIGKLIILVSSIMMLNVIGVSYAQWNDNISMTTSITTGYIHPYFIEDGNNITRNLNTSRVSRSKEKDIEAASIGEDKSMGDISARFINGNTLEISGWCYPNYNKDISVKFGNDGTIPIAYKGIEAEDDDDIVKQIQYNGSSIKENDRKIKQRNQNMINAKDKEEIEIHIQAGDDSETEYGNRSFTYELQFEQGLK